MSSLLNPKGPEQPSTYWRRRAAILVGLLVVLWLAWWLLGAAFGGDEDPATEPSASPSLGSSVAPSPQAATSASPSPTAEPVAAARARAVSCDRADVTVAAATESDSAGVGQGLALTMSVTNTGEDPCRRDVGPGANEIAVTSGSVLVWSSDACASGEGKDRVALEPGSPFSTSVTWSGEVTGAECPDAPAVAQAGTYRVVARNGTVESAPVVFTIE